MYRAHVLVSRRRDVLLREAKRLLKRLKEN